MADKKNLSEIELERLIHLSSKVLEYVYIPEYEDYFNQSRLDDSFRDDQNDDWIIEDKLNDSDHIFKYIYNLKQLITKIKSNGNT
jgi:hypothetical protein